jgi:hypothetical protein
MTFATLKWTKTRPAHNQYPTVYVYTHSDHIHNCIRGKSNHTCELGKRTPAAQTVVLDVGHEFCILFRSPGSSLHNHLVTAWLPPHPSLNMLATSRNIESQDAVPLKRCHFDES